VHVHVCVGTWMERIKSPWSAVGNRTLRAGELRPKRTPNK